ncbi:hypothetical protein R0137_09550 [Congregibacter brevis]|uniref:Uncharacterized protein n=1 Tax=Congregibacter brevis TaxID=3081201 RepID=A0ABZ0I8Q8_9GAMM|nr:hypothetical protein R0137_09550 [Congregibacter sp. IMCC45268]
MQIKRKQWAAVAAIGLLVAQGSLARDVATNGDLEKARQKSFMSAAFQSPASSTVRPLDAQLMDTTQGELWPWIFGVVAVDISLASFFWGEYVPIMAASGGACITCDIGKKAR